MKCQACLMCQPYVVFSIHSALSGAKLNIPTYFFLNDRMLKKIDLRMPEKNICIIDSVEYSNPGNSGKSKKMTGSHVRQVCRSFSLSSFPFVSLLKI